MKISHVISSIDISNGGPSRSSVNLVEKLSSKKYNLNLIATKTKNPIITSFKNKTANLHLCKRSFLGYSFEMNKKLISEKPDLFHGHGIWNLAIHQMAVVARKLSIPYIISPRGMLEPWPLKQSVFKKRFALSLYQKNDLNKSICIHATATSEAQNIRSLGFNNPIAVIPNGINISEFPDYSKKRNSVRKILFLSRIDKKKGIEVLINAFNQISDKLTDSWEVEIVGNGDIKYINKLKSLASLKNKKISISGPVFGKLKYKKFQSADLFVLPTYSENFGIVVAEALACKVPVICTKGAPWHDLNKYNCGSWIEIGLEPLKQTLISFLSKNDNELKQMGVNGRFLIEKKYSIHSVSEKLAVTYSWLLNKAEKPNFIY